MRNNKYILIFLSSFFLLCISFIALSFYANPYDINDLLSPKSQTNYFGGTRTAKAAHIIEGNYDAFILGSSRSEIGINPTHKLWGHLQTYNASLAGSNFVETYKVFQTITKHHNPKLIVLALDYSLFSGSRSTSADFKLSRFDDLNSSFSSFFKEHLSKESIEKSFRTLKYERLKAPSKHKLGQKNGNLSFAKKINEYGQQKLIFRTLRKKVILNKSAYSKSGFSNARIQLLLNMIKICNDKKIKLLIFISPIHALQLATFYQLGYWENFITWKRQLTAILAEYPGTILYDFTAWNAYMTETIPSTEKAHAMKWYWETSHYKEELGDKILDRLFNVHKQNNKNFGIPLNTNNIEKELSSQTQHLLRYIEQNPKLMQQIKHIIVSLK